MIYPNNATGCPYNLRSHAIPRFFFSGSRQSRGCQGTGIQLLGTQIYVVEVVVVVVVPEFVLVEGDVRVLP